MAAGALGNTKSGPAVHPAATDMIAPVSAARPNVLAPFAVARRVLFLANIDIDQLARKEVDILRLAKAEDDRQDADIHLFEPLIAQLDFRRNIGLDTLKREGNADIRALYVHSRGDLGERRQ